MVVYYLYKVSESLTDYRYPIKEGDICLLYDGEVVKTIYVDSETDADSIWRDFKYIDSKSLKNYQFPKTDSVLCAPIGERHAIGNTRLLTQLIQECKGEWLHDNIEIAYGDEEELSAFTEMSDEGDTGKPEDENVDDEYADIDIPSKNYDIRWFCLSVISCIEDQMDRRSYEILHDRLKNDSKSEIASRYNLTQERIRQIVTKAIKQAKELFIKQHENLEEAKAKNAQLEVQLSLLREEIDGLKTMLPKDTYISEDGKYEDLDDFGENLKEKVRKTVTVPAMSSYMFGSGLKTVSEEMDRSFDKIERDAMSDIHLSITENQRNTQRLLLEDKSGLEYLYVAMLDSKTCAVCGGYSGNVYKDLSEAPTLPVHHLCRCYYLPVKKEQEYDRESYSEWFDRQPDSVKYKILGPSRYGFYKSGMKFIEFTSKGRKLSLSELFEK